MNIIFSLILIAILIVLSPIILLVLLVVLAFKWREINTSAPVFTLYVNIAFELPTLWLTKNEVRLRIDEKYSTELEDLLASKHIDAIFENFGSGGTEHLPPRERLIELYVSMFFPRHSARSFFEREKAFFHPSHDGEMLNPTGMNDIGRTFRLPSPALSDDDNRLAQNGESIEIDFVRKRGMGKKSPPKQGAATERQNTPGPLEPLRT